MTAASFTVTMAMTMRMRNSLSEVRPG